MAHAKQSRTLHSIGDQHISLNAYNMFVGAVGMDHNTIPLLLNTMVKHRSADKYIYLSNMNTDVSTLYFNSKHCLDALEVVEAIKHAAHSTSVSLAQLTPTLASITKHEHANKVSPNTSNT